jgi:16S rRNA (cytosine967-C5)-methyltransferase
MAGFSGKINGEPGKDRVHCLDLSKTPTPMLTATAFRQFDQWFNVAAFDFPRCGQFFKFISHNFCLASQKQNAILKLVTSQNPRQIAAQILGRRSHDKFTEPFLDRELAAARLSPVDRGLCQEIVYGAVRWQATLDWLIQRKTKHQAQKAALQNLLRLGLYQIFWLDRIPAHAAVHETVETAKHLGFGPQAGFVNAILRGYLREFDATKKILADLKNTDLATGYSHPKWLVERWQKNFGPEKMRQLLDWNNLPPKTYARVNTIKTDAGKLLERWREEGVEYDFLRRDWLGENLVFELKSHPSLASLGSFQEGWFYVQDPSTLPAALALAPAPGETVLDLCAAPGGKTTFLAQLIRNEGKIAACDISQERLELIRENCTRLGVTCVEVIQRAKLNAQRSTYDKILVDAPCSNSGVMRRRVDLRWRISLDEISRLKQTQLELLAFADSKLKPGGVLVYSTCSLEPEENGEVVKEFLDGHKNYKLASQQQLLPFVDGVDGVFVARFIR